MSTLVKATLAEQAYQELRSRIVSGRLAGGTRLLPNELAEDLGISPTPVKEACARLDELAMALAHDRQFHHAIVSRAGIGMVSDWHDRILSQTHTVFVSVPGHYERSIGDHRAILDAVTARSLERTLKMIDEHLTNSRANARLLVSRLDQVVVEAG